MQPLAESQCVGRRPAWSTEHVCAAEPREHPITHPPVVFVHGLWMHASSWNPWIERFAAAGYQASAADWPGDPATVQEARTNQRSMADRGIEEIVEHHKRYIGGLDERPIVIGHSLGGLIIQRLLAEDFAVAGVAIGPAPIKGVLRLPLSSLEVAFPMLRTRGNARRAIALTREQFASRSATPSQRKNPTNSSTGGPFLVRGGRSSRRHSLPLPCARRPGSR